MSIFKYLTLSHLQKVLAALDVKFLGINNEISEIKEDVNKVETELNNIDIKQSDWKVTNEKDSAYILNKPSIDGDPFNYSIEEGWETTASGYMSHAEGDSTTASGYASHAEGSSTTASGEESHSEGFRTTASSHCSHSEGYFTTASGNYSHAEGCREAGLYLYLTGNAGATTYNVTGTGYSNILYKDVFKLLVGSKINNSTVVSIKINGSSLSTVTFDKTLSETDAINHVRYEFKLLNIAKGNGSHTSGNSTQAIGDYSFTEGNITQASGIASHSEGIGTLASSNYQHVQGKYNIEDSNNIYANIVGNGTEYGKRSNAYTLDWNGNAWYAGKVSAGTVSSPANPTAANDLATKKYVDDATAGITSNLSGLTDTTISSPTDGQILQYNSTASKWVNGDIPSDLFIVNITRSGSGSNITYSADKTYNEIRNAYFNNKECIAVYNNNIYNLIQASNSGTISFSYCLSANTNVAVETINIASNNYVSLFHDNVYPATYVDYFEQGITKINSDYKKATNSYESGDLFWKKSFSSTGLDPWVLAKATTNISVNDELTVNVNFTTTTIEDELGLKSSITEVLTKTNTTSYTPTSDYHPATKKYVDDATNGITSNLSLAISNNVIQLKEGNTVISSVTLPIYNGGVSS